MILYVIVKDLQLKIVENDEEREATMNEKKPPLSTAINIAKYIIGFCNNQDKPVLISNIKLQKLLYLVFGYYCLDGEGLLFNDTFQAWQYGPAVAEVYDQFCAFAGSYIYLSEPSPILPEAITTVINPTIKKNMNRDVFDLVEETHQPGSAWSKAIKRSGGDKKPDILLDDIIEEFRKKRDSNGTTSTV